MNLLQEQTPITRFETINGESIDVVVQRQIAVAKKYGSIEDNETLEAEIIANLDL